jgi:hypothetical protein
MSTTYVPGSEDIVMKTLSLNVTLGMEISFKKGGSLLTDCNQELYTPDSLNSSSCKQ